MARARKLFQHEQASGLLMIGALSAALVVANSPAASLYQAVHHLPVHFRIGPLVLDRPLVTWINEGLMVFFFLLVGLEIKRQFREGHLSTTKHAALPAFAAAGGIAVPALLYTALNWQDPSAIHGWAIPTATDIVLVLGVLALLGSRVPDGLKVFLAAIAIFDDVAAVLIIGMFFGDGIEVPMLVLALLGVGGLFLLNRFCLTRVAYYVAFGVFLWIVMLEAGLQPALVGILIAFAIPMRSRRRRSPVREVERKLHPWGALFVVPVFAFFNGGVQLKASAIQDLATPVSLGVILGLFVGKQLGIASAAWFAVRFGAAALPLGVTWTQLYGAALLAGIGFTISVFIATLAFDGAGQVAAAKLAVLVGSTVSGVGGIAVIYLATARVGVQAALRLDGHRQ